MSIAAHIYSKCFLYLYDRCTSPDDMLKQSGRGEGGGGDTPTHTLNADGKRADASDGQSRTYPHTTHTNVTNQGIAERFGRKADEQEEEAKEEEEEEEAKEEEEEEEEE